MKTSIYPPCFYRVSAKALIYKDNKVLLIKEDNGMWELPGGGLEIGETFSLGIKRELKEELGINMINISSQPKYVWTLIDNNKPKLILLFLVEVDSFDFNGNPKESLEIGFFNKEEMKNMNLHPNIQELPIILIN